MAVFVMLLLGEATDNSKQIFFNVFKKHARHSLMGKQNISVILCKSKEAEEKRG